MRADNEKAVKKALASAKTYEQLRAATGLGRATLCAWVSDQRKRQLVHIAGWAKDKAGRLFVPKFKMGSAADTPRPGPSRTPAERMRAMRLKGGRK